MNGVGWRYSSGNPSKEGFGQNAEFRVPGRGAQKSRQPPGKELHFAACGFLRRRWASQA